MLEIYKGEREKVFRVGMVLQRKWDDACKKMDMDKPSSQKNSLIMEQWANEAKNRYAEIGFEVIVDITPSLAGVKPPTISLAERIEKKLTDHERIAHEIKKEQ